MAGRRLTVTDMHSDVHLFLVDDHTVIRQALASMLSGQPGLVVVGQTDSAESALEMMQSIHTDVAIVDLSLPEHGGAWLTRELATAASNVRVLIVSMHQDYASVNAAFQAGALGYLPKSAGREELVMALAVIHQGGVYLHRSVFGFFLSALASATEPEVRVTPREAAILEAVRSGLSNQEIADRTYLSVPMVKKHLHILYRKLGVENRTQLMHGSTKELETR